MTAPLSGDSCHLALPSTVLHLNRAGKTALVYGNIAACVDIKMPLAKPVNECTNVCCVLPTSVLPDTQNEQCCRPSDQSNLRIALTVCVADIH